MPDIDPAGVQIVESATPDNVQTGDQNGLLSLATSLKETEPALGDFMGQLGGQLRQHQEDKAQAAAFSNSGQAFAEAVRSGKLEPTQNPWFIQAYNRDSANIRSRAAVTDLVDQSQTWAERSDPQAFQSKFNQQLGQIASQFTSIDAAEGFKQGAMPLAKQAIDANTEYNVQRINQEHTQNVSTLMTTALQDSMKAAGGKLTPEAAQAALAPLVSQWTSTGGTVPQARQMMLNSVVAAASNTGNATALDVLNSDFDGHGALANMSNAQGQPVAEDLLRSRYYIERMASQDPEAKARVKAIQEEGAKGYSYLEGKYGYALLKGQVTEADMISDLQAQGISPAGAKVALAQSYAEIHEASLLGTALAALKDQDPTNISKNAKLLEMAITQGDSKQLQAGIDAGIRDGTLMQKDVDTLTQKAAMRTMHNEDKAQSAFQHADSEERVARRAAAQDYKQTVDEVVGTIVDKRLGANDKIFLDPAQRAKLKVKVLSRGEAVLSQTGQDYAKAQAAMYDMGAQILRGRAAEWKGRPPPPPGGTPNPLGGSK